MTKESQSVELLHITDAVVSYILISEFPSDYAEAQMTEEDIKSLPESEIYWYYNNWVLPSRT